MPVGTPGGIVSGFDSVGVVGVVRLGDEFVSLDLTSYKLWQALSVAPSEETARALATRVGDEHADHLSVLTSNGLLATWSPDPGEALALARTHSVSFIGCGLGNGERPAPMFLVGGADGRPRARVNVVVYEFLLAGDGRYSVAQACERLGFDLLGLADEPPLHVVAALPELMRTGLIRLDLVAEVA
jgi:hypothetical protein